MDYITKILELLKTLNENQLKCVYQFIKGMLD